jgi:hypothetical protein
MAGKGVAAGMDLVTGVNLAGAGLLLTGPGPMAGDMAAGVDLVMSVNLAGAGLLQTGPGPMDMAAGVDLVTGVNLAGASPLQTGPGPMAGPDLVAAADPAVGGHQAERGH